MSIQTTRRALFGALALAPIAGTLAAIPAPSPLLAAIAASRAADRNFESLPEDLENTHPTLHRAEEQKLLDAYVHARSQPPVSWAEFAILFEFVTHGGEFGLDEDVAGMMLGHARRLAKEGR